MGTIVVWESKIMNWQNSHLWIAIISLNYLFEFELNDNYSFQISKKKNCRKREWKKEMDQIIV